jgi:drug/metabolite transporter (DMT)-like permease
VGGVLLALASSMGWGLSDFLGGNLSRGRPAVVVLLVAQATAITILTIVVLAVGGAPPPAVDLAPGVLSGLGTGLGVLALYQALAIGPMSVVAPLFALGAVVPVGYGMATGDDPSWLQGVGMVAAVGGCFLAARSEQGGVPVRRAGIVYALLAAVGIGIGFVGIDAAADADPLWGLEVTRATSFLAIAVLAVVLRGRALARDLRPIWPLPAIGAIEVTANGCFAFASTMGLLSVVSVLGSIYPVVTVLLARWLLHERMAPAQATGVALAFGGVAMLVGG